MRHDAQRWASWLLWFGFRLVGDGFDVDYRRSADAGIQLLAPLACLCFKARFWPLKRRTKPGLETSISRAKLEKRNSGRRRNYANASGCAVHTNAHPNRAPQTSWPNLEIRLIVEPTIRLDHHKFLLFAVLRHRHSGRKRRMPNEFQLPAIALNLGQRDALVLIELAFERTACFIAQATFVSHCEFSGVLPSRIDHKAYGCGPIFSSSMLNRRALASLKQHQGLAVTGMRKHIQQSGFSRLQTGHSA